MAKIKTREQVIASFIKKHDNKYNYSLVEYTGANNKVTIVCPIHGQFEQTASDHLNGRGCKSCADSAKRSNVGHFENKANIIHASKYNYELVDYIQGTAHVIIICPIHGPFKMTPNNHIQGYGCKLCAHDLRRSTKEHFIAKANMVHNNFYTYDVTEYINITTKIQITCPIHGIFTQSPRNHLQGDRCKYCKESKGEILIRDWLTNNNIQYTTQHNPIVGHPKLRFDFWLPNHQLLIEFDGIQHYKPVDRFGGQEAFDAGQLRDQQKTQWCLDNNIDLLRIPYTEIKNINEILSHALFITTNVV